MGEEVKIDNSDFEILFYEGILQKKGDFLEALSALGNLHTQKGMYQKGLIVDQKLSQLRPGDPVILYNLACSYSLLSETDLALRTIKKAINCGYDDFEHLERDQDLVNLRKDNRFMRYFQRIKNQKLPDGEPPA